VRGDTPSIGKNRESIENTSMGLTREDVGRMIESSISSLNIPSRDSSDLEEMTRASIEVALEPINISIDELEAYARSQFAAVRDELKAVASCAVEIPVSLAEPLQQSIASTRTLPRQEKPHVDGNTKTWGEFFKMVGIEAMTAVEAQKKQDTDTRTKQIEIGLQAAKDQGLGEWAVKRAGRDFMRVEELTRS
jgi:hypothetical protein